MSKKAKLEYVDAVRGRYLAGEKVEKSRILDEFCKVIGLHRKSAIRLLHRQGTGARSVANQPGRKPTYKDAELVEALVLIWQRTNLICSKRLAACLPLWLKYYPRVLSKQCYQRLETVSASTIDRLLKPYRRRFQKRGLCTTKPGSLLKQQIPIKTNQWDESRPGFMEADTVSHCGSSAAGTYVSTLNMVDIATTWNEQRAVWGKGERHTHQAIQDIERALPFPMRGFDCDNGGELLNWHLKNYFEKRRKPVDYTRSREYHKNDNAHVESKNWSIIRQYLGYERFDNPQAVSLLNDLYSNEWRYLINGFVPSMKLVAKHRRGSKIIKQYDAPKTPLERVLNSAHVLKYRKQHLKRQFKNLNPFELARIIKQKINRILAIAQLPTTTPPRLSEARPPHARARRTQTLNNILSQLTQFMDKPFPTHSHNPKKKTNCKKRKILRLSR